MSALCCLLSETGERGLKALTRFVNELRTLGVRLSMPDLFFEMATFSVVKRRRSALTFLREMLLQSFRSAVFFYIHRDTELSDTQIISLCRMEWKMPPDDVLTFIDSLTTVSASGSHVGKNTA